MKTVVLTPDCSVKSTSTTATTTTTTAATSNANETENQDSCYYLGCRRDANCDCKICLASINATLDLMPQSIQRSSLTKLSSSRPIPGSSVSFNPTIFSTPTSSNRRVSISPPLNSTARMSFHEKMRRKKRELGIGLMLMRLVLGLSSFFVAEHGFSWLISGILRPELSTDTVRNVGEKSMVLQDLNQRAEFLKNELESLVVGKVSNCSSPDAKWEINQDGLLLNSRCTLYKSATEKVSLWGWPLQTAGLLTTEFSSRSFTILGGRVTQWPDGEVSYMIQDANSSWTQGKWNASVVHLDPATWILEYQRSSVVENARLSSAALEFLQFRIKREVKKMQQQFWLFSVLGTQHKDFTGDSSKIPT